VASGKRDGRRACGGRVRLIGLGDLHCGSHGGLTPPGWQVSHSRYPLAHALQQESWEKYDGLVRLRGAGRPEGFKLVVVCNGDALDGPKNPGECVTPDRFEQCRMAAECLSMWGADEYYFTFGTPFHTGKEEPWEKILARSGCDQAGSDKEMESWPGGDIAPTQFIDIGGKIFFFRHKVGRGSVPHTRHTAQSRAQLWNQINKARGREPHADVLCFSHTHYHAGAFGRDWLAMTLPALQTTSSFGARECDGEVDWGIAYFDIVDGQLMEWGADILEIEEMRARVHRVR